MSDTIAHPDAANERQFDLRYTGDDVERDGAVPAAVLAKSLEGLQRLVHLVAMRIEGRELNKRARPSEDIQLRFPVLCLPPREGSYISPTMIGRIDAQQLDFNEAGKIAQELVIVMQAATSGDSTALDRAVPDPTYRRFMYAALNDMLPPSHLNLELEVQQSGHSHLVASQARPLLTRSRARAADQSQGVATGILFEIDFEKRQFALYHPPTESRIICGYDEGGEDLLLDHPLDRIQVTGLIERDTDGNLVRVVSVEKVLEIDTSPYSIDRLDVDGKQLLTNKPISIEPIFDDGDQIFLVSLPELGIETFAETRAELEGVIEDELRMIWREYAEASDDTLADDALKLKRQLLATFVEAGNAAQT